VIAARKCELCKEAAFIPLPGWIAGQIPTDWLRVPIQRALLPTATGPTLYEDKMLLCPFCIAIARALQKADVEHARFDRAVNRGIPHPFKDGGFGIADRPCVQCGLPDRDPIHQLDKNIHRFEAGR
jgi:hypothetical protein